MLAPWAGDSASHAISPQWSGSVLNLVEEPALCLDPSHHKCVFDLGNTRQT
jgi:hypothetical protein